MKFRAPSGPAKETGCEQEWRENHQNDKADNGGEQPDDAGGRPAQPVENGLHNTTLPGCPLSSPEGDPL